MKQRESNQSKCDTELEKRTKQIRKKYTGKIPNSIFDALSNY